MASKQVSHKNPIQNNFPYDCNHLVSVRLYHHYELKLRIIANEHDLSLLIHYNFTLQVYLVVPLCFVRFFFVP
jgi:hypothetical protein